MHKILDVVVETDDEMDKMLLSHSRGVWMYTRGKLTKLQSQGHTFFRIVREFICTLQFLVVYCQFIIGL